MVKNLPAMQEKQETWFNYWVKKIPWHRKWQPTPVFFPGKFQTKEPGRVEHTHIYKL